MTSTFQTLTVGQLLLVGKHSVFTFYKVTSEQFEFCNKSHVTAVTMSMMTFQYGVYFVFKI
jgi:hypothetical protein